MNNTNDKTKVASLSVISNTFLTLFKIIIGLISGSVSILSEGIHSGLDLVAAFIALFAVKNSEKPADADHTYGHGKIENVSGTIEALLIFIAAIMIIAESFHKFIAILNGVDGGVSTLGLGLIIMGLSALINFFVSKKLMKIAKQTDSIALEADALHLKTDVYTSAGVFIGLLLIKITGLTILDPIIAFLVALIIIKASFELIKQAFMPLLDTSLSDEDCKIINKVLSYYKDEFIEFHTLRTRKSGSERHVDLHLVVAKNSLINDVHELCDVIENDIKDEFDNISVLIHIEPCKKNDENCPIKQGTTNICRCCNSFIDKESLK